MLTAEGEIELLISSKRRRRSYQFAATSKSICSRQTSWVLGWRWFKPASGWWSLLAPLSLPLPAEQANCILDYNPFLPFSYWTWWDAVYSNTGRLSSLTPLSLNRGENNVLYLTAIFKLYNFYKRIIIFKFFTSSQAYD